MLDCLHFTSFSTTRIHRTLSTPLKLLTSCMPGINRPWTPMSVCGFATNEFNIALTSRSLLPSNLEPSCLESDREPVNKPFAAAVCYASTKALRLPLVAMHDNPPREGVLVARRTWRQFGQHTGLPRPALRKAPGLDRTDLCHVV